MNKSVRNLWWPDLETDYVKLEDYIVRRVTDADVVASHTKTKGIAVQAGGHVGLFPRQLAKHFAFVHTFEAIPETFECLQLNIAQRDNILAENVALGAVVGKTTLMPRNGGRSKIDPHGHISAVQTTIDALNLVRCDLIYLDIEGFELPALAGAKITIDKFRPTIAVEVLSGQHEKVQAWADANKYNLAARVHSDWIFTP